MGTVYFHLGGFIFTDPSLVGKKFFCLIINKDNGDTKRIEFTYNDARRIRKSYIIPTQDNHFQTISVELYKNDFFKETFLGRVDIPVGELPVDAVTYNTIPLMFCNVNKLPTALRAVIHLSKSSAPYSAPKVDPVLPQIDIEKYLDGVISKEDCLGMDCPLLRRQTL